MEIVVANSDELLALIPTVLWQDDDDFIDAALVPGDDKLTINLANCHGEAGFVCDFSRATKSEKNLARSLVRHLAHYQAMRITQGDLASALAEAQAQAAAAQAKADELAEQNMQLKKTLFGASSEKLPKDDAGDPSDDPPPRCHSGARAPHLHLIKGAGRKPLPAFLPRDRVEYDIPPERRLCPDCHGALHHVGADETEQLTVIPVQYRVRHQVRHKYACSTCQKIICAEVPKSMVPGGTYNTPEFLAHVATSRFQLGLPYFRQEMMFAQAGLNVTRTTLADAMISCADKLTSLMAVLHSELLKQSTIHADETTMQVLKEPNRSPESKSYIWLYRSGQFEQKPVVYFEYQETRGGVHPKVFLAPEGCQPYSGYLQVDGYSGYNTVPGIKRVGCMTHVRRKFVSALDVLPSGSQQNTEAAKALEMIGKLYAVERKLSDQPPKRRCGIRQAESRPILNQLGKWLEEMKAKTLPKTSLGKAVRYAVDQWPHVCRYIEDGRL